MNWGIGSQLREMNFNIRTSPAAENKFEPRPTLEVRITSPHSVPHIFDSMFAVSPLLSTSKWSVTHVDGRHCENSTPWDRSGRISVSLRDNPSNKKPISTPRLPVSKPLLQRRWWLQPLANF